MKAYTVTFSDGNTLVTSMNATLEEATAYYTRNCFNFGDTEECMKDRMVKGIKVEAL